MGAVWVRCAIDDNPHIVEVGFGFGFGQPAYLSRRSMPQMETFLARSAQRTANAEKDNAHGVTSPPTRDQPHGQRRDAGDCRGGELELESLQTGRATSGSPCSRKVRDTAELCLCAPPGCCERRVPPSKSGVAVGTQRPPASSLPPPPRPNGATCQIQPVEGLHLKCPHIYFSTEVAKNSTMSGLGGGGRLEKPEPPSASSRS